MNGSQISGMKEGMMPQVQGIDIAERQKETAGVLFADMISMGTSFRTDDRMPETADDLLNNVQSDKMDARKENVSDVYKKYRYKENPIRTESGAVSEKDVEKAEEELMNFSEGVTEVLQEELHVTKEEIEAAMEKLGLQFIDLLEPVNLANLVAQLGGSENLNQLLCSEAFTNVLRSIKELGNVMLSDLQMTPEELQAVITEQTDSLKADAEETFAGETVQKTGTKAEEVSAQADETVQPDGSEKTVVVEDNRVDSKKIKEMDMAGEENAQDGMTEEEQNSFFKADDKQIPKMNVSVQGEAAGFQTVQTNGMENRTDGIRPESVPTYISVMDIMEQFAEQTKVTFSNEMTKMEMQLNPEHLGKLYLEISESEGAVTAKIQTQNAVVKEALEMQIADLRQSLNQAGVKVDAVEVTVSSHEFERNLEQDANSQKQQEEAQPKQTKHRSINLNSLDELSGLMSEEEELVAKMMAEQGNRVDFTV